jgi:hypothetical protein
MQFRLGTLFLWTTALALFCGAAFALPVPLAGVVLLATMLASPAVWVAGASYASGGKGAFFRGGLLCGILPFVTCSLTLLLSVVQSFSENEISVWFFVPITSTGDSDLNIRLGFALLWLTPGVFCCLGGGLSWFVFRLFAAPQSQAQSQPSAAAYRVISGRLTTAVPLPAADDELRRTIAEDVR